MSAWQQQATAPRRDLQRLQSRISFIVQDMDALGRRCSGETALDLQTMDDSCDFRWPLACSLGGEPPATAIRPPATPDPTPKPVVSIASSSGVHNKRKSLSIGLLSAAGEKEAAKVVQEDGNDDQGHEGAVMRRVARSEAQAQLQ